MKPETWKPVPGYEGWYSVSDRGRIRRDLGERGTQAGLILKLRPERYLRVYLWKEGRGKFRTVHRMVAAAFLGVCPVGLSVNHKNGQKWDNRPENLEYVTHAENAQHSARVLGNHVGERNPNAKLTRAKALAIRKLCQTSRGQRPKIAARFCISLCQVNKIASGACWV